jgi:hypothetical protein
MLAAAACAAALAGCNNNDAAAPAATEAATPPAETPAAAATGWDRAALGLREQQLLEADLLGIDGVKLGSIEGLLTGADDRVDRLLVEVEDSDPDRFVAVPVQGLTALTRGSDIDVVSTMTVAQLTALPDAPAPTATPTTAPAT